MAELSNMLAHWLNNSHNRGVNYSLICSAGKAGFREPTHSGGHALKLDGIIYYSIFESALHDLEIHKSVVVCKSTLYIICCFF